MTEKKLCIDLCAGLGGFSRAFKESPDWEVVTIEIERKFKPTIIADVCHLPIKENTQPTLLLASPPCNKFSVAGGAFPRKGVQKALEIVGACFESVACLKPKWYLIENPRGYLRGIIGKPRTTIRYSDYDWDFKAQKPTDLWGNLPLPMVKKVHRPKMPLGCKKWHDYMPNPVKAAEIPLGVSQAVLEGVTQK